ARRSPGADRNVSTRIDRCLQGLDLSDRRRAVRIGKQDEPPARIDHARPNGIALTGVRRQPAQADLRVLASEAEDEAARAVAAPVIDHQDLGGAVPFAEVPNDLSKRLPQPGFLVERGNYNRDFGSHADPPANPVVHGMGKCGARTGIAWGRARGRNERYRSSRPIAAQL